MLFAENKSFLVKVQPVLQTTKCGGVRQTPHVIRDVHMIGVLTMS